MKFLLTVVLVAGLAFGAWNLYSYWNQVSGKNNAPAASAAAPDIGDSLAGMPPNLQGVLQGARQRGAAGLHDFLTMYGNTIRDPRRAWLELDYVVLLAQSNPGEARKQFAKTKARVGPDSPVYPRLQQLEKTYE